MSDYDQSDNNLNVYAWDNNVPKSRIEVDLCPNCNHSLTSGSNCGNNTKCSSCGYAVKLYGYNNLEFDETRDNGSKAYDYQQAPVKPIVEFDKEKKETFEVGNTGKAIGAYLSASLCITMIAFMVAVFRDELSHKNGNINFSLLLCILIFPQLYLTYAIVDFATRPKY